MLRGTIIPNNIIKIGKRWFVDKESVFFSSKKRQKNTLSQYIEINKQILNNENIFEIVKLIKDNKKNVNIINCVTFVHKLIRIICYSNDTRYLKNAAYVNEEIEEKIKIIFHYFTKNKENIKVNNYNKRLFSSFIWSLSKYVNLFKGNDKHDIFVNTTLNNDLVLQCTDKVQRLKKVLLINEGKKNARDVQNLCVSKENHPNGMQNVKYGSSSVTKGYLGNIGNDKLSRTLIYYGMNSPFQKLDNQEEQFQCKGKNNPPMGGGTVRYSLCNNFSLLCHYADAYLPSLNPSRYVLVLWSLSKLNKNSKELHERYYHRSVNLIPLLKVKELIILLYTYSYINFSNIEFYLKMKNFIMSRNIHKKIVSAKENESVVNMLLSFANQNIFLQDLFESTVNQILHSNFFLNSLKNNELITILFCLCKCPFLYIPDDNNFRILEKKEKKECVRKNILLYELLKKKIMKRYAKIRHQNGSIFWMHEYGNIFLRHENIFEGVKRNTSFSLKNLILLVWSLSLKYIYSAQLLLSCFIHLNGLMKNQNYVYNSYNMLTNLYFSLLSFLLEDEIVINLYFNREELNALHLLDEYVNAFKTHFSTFKKAINMNQRENDISVSNMQKVIFNFLCTYFKDSKNVSILLEYKNILNLSVDILLLRTSSSAHMVENISASVEELHGIFLCNQIFNYNGVGNISPDGSVDRKKDKESSNSIKVRASKCSKMNNGVSSGIPFVYHISYKTLCTWEKRECNRSTEMFNTKKSNNSMKKMTNLFVTLEKTNMSCEEIRSNLYGFIERIKNLNEKMDARELKKIFKDIHIFFEKYFIHIKEHNLISFFYKFSFLFPQFYKLKNNSNGNSCSTDFLKIFSYYHDYTTITFFKNVNSKKVYHFVDICWVYFRYMKYFLIQLKEINEDKRMSREKKTEKITNEMILEEIRKITSIFDTIIKNKMISEQMIERMSSKNMAQLISIFLHHNNSNIVEYLKKNNFHNIIFTIKDIIFILNALTKSDFVWEIEKKMFCNKFIEHIDKCGVRDLVEFTYLCAELKCSSDYISIHIRNKINSPVFLLPLPKRRNENRNKVERKIDPSDKKQDVCSASSTRIKFIETFEQDELSLFVRNCYRMHCFDKHFFDTLCEVILKRYRTLSEKNLCIVLPSFARIYCLHKGRGIFPNIGLKPGNGQYAKGCRINQDDEIDRIDRIDRSDEDSETNDILDPDISNCRYDVPVSLKRLVKNAEVKIVSNKNVNFINLAYFMEAITLLKIENKRAYTLCVKEVEHKIASHVYNEREDLRGNKKKNWGGTEKEVKLLSKILWCMSYYHRTEFALTLKITNFLLKNGIYKYVSPEIFISVFLYYIKSRIYSRTLFQKMGETIRMNISLNDHFARSEIKRQGNFKLSLITELYGTMAWAYAFTYCYADDVKLKTVEATTMKKNNHEEKSRKSEKKKKINTEYETLKSEIKNDSIFLNKIYTFLLTEMKILQKYQGGVSFLLLARYLWGIAIVNLINEKVLDFINSYNWNAIKITEQNNMHLHMILTFWLRVKYSFSDIKICKDFYKFKDQIICLFLKKKKKKTLKGNDHKDTNNISDFHHQINQILDKYEIKYENEYITEDFLSVDLVITDESTGYKIAIEVDGPSHHLLILDKIDPRVKKLYVQCGTTYFKNWLLKRMGWMIINIPSYEWNKLKEEEKDIYVIRKLSSCSEYHKNHLEKWLK
ncbi:hypothetical protein, conserved [Plasmodium gonderi]|uniref:RAP domain-containing protein n=1 Tax=Plasmodium gonderi TaxID=77519 RepID=A0A1Y1JJB6_PLAGO|nr:hypothetical protein, conserved [Plasmodium gonderi]GAW82551.1 hypothetical protein, conserved [Plasmodium gonderi]